MGDDDNGHSSLPAHVLEGFKIAFPSDNPTHPSVHRRAEVWDFASALQWKPLLFTAGAGPGSCSGGHPDPPLYTVFASRISRDLKSCLHFPVRSGSNQVIELENETDVVSSGSPSAASGNNRRCPFRPLRLLSSEALSMLLRILKPWFFPAPLGPTTTTPAFINGKIQGLPHGSASPIWYFVTFFSFTKIFRHNAFLAFLLYQFNYNIIFEDL